MTTVSETLNMAADLIEERGWTTGVPGWGEDEAPGTALCLEGGIVAALGMDIELDTRSHKEFERCPAYRAVQSYLGLDPERDESDWAVNPLWRWNDARTSAAEVIEVLRAAAVIEAARENESAAVEVGA